MRMRHRGANTPLAHRNGEAAGAGRPACSRAKLHAVTYACSSPQYRGHTGISLRSKIKPQKNYCDFPAVFSIHKSYMFHSKNTNTSITFPAFFGVQQASSSHANVPVHQVVVQCSQLHACICSWSSSSKEKNPK
jgi:hypothetical protein